MSHRLAHYLHHLFRASNAVGFSSFSTHSQISPRRESDQREHSAHPSLHHLLLLLPGSFSVLRSSNQSELLPYFHQRVQLRSAHRQFLRSFGLPISILGRRTLYGALVLRSAAQSRWAVDVGRAGIRFASVFDDVRNRLAAAESYQRNRDCLDVVDRSAIFVEEVGRGNERMTGSGYFYLLFPSSSVKENRELEKNLKTVMDE